MKPVSSAITLSNTVEYEKIWEFRKKLESLYRRYDTADGFSPIRMILIQEIIDMFDYHFQTKEPKRNP